MPTAPWPCPVCAEVLPSHLDDCPQCQLPGAWLDLILALGFGIRQFHYWSVVGELEQAQYREIVDEARQRQDQLTRAAFSDQPLPDTALPDRLACWRCRHDCGPSARICAACGAPLDAPEVRLLRYHTFLAQEITNHAQAGRLTGEQTGRFLADTAKNLADLAARLEKKTSPVLKT